MGGLSVPNVRIFDQNGYLRDIQSKKFWSNKLKKQSIIFIVLRLLDFFFLGSTYLIQIFGPNGPVT